MITKYYFRIESSIPGGLQNRIRTSIPNTVRNRELVKTARMRYLQPRNPVVDTVTSPDSNIETQRFMQFQNLLTSPINRRLIRTRSVASSSSSSSSAEETDDESVGNYGSAFLSEDYDIEDESTDSKDQQTNEVLDNLIWRFTPYHHTDERLRLAAHEKCIYSHQTELKTGVGGSFKTPLGALQVVGGFDFDTLKRLCRNSNECIKMCVLPSCTNQLLYGIRFEDITLSEMIKFFGISEKAVE